MRKIIANNKEFDSISQLDWLDVGCSEGKSYSYIQSKFGKNGLGIDIDPVKVETSRKAGVPAIQLDACNMHIFSDGASKVVTFMHTLEHLPNVDIVGNILKESIRVATDKVFIRGPMFYSKYLNELGFQFYWSNWRGHTCHIEPDEIVQIMDEFGYSKYNLMYTRKVHSSKDPCIHPLGGKIDRHDYDRKIDPPKNHEVNFENIHGEFELIFDLKRKY
jgi:hypothetical protein